MVIFFSKLNPLSQTTWVHRDEPSHVCFRDTKAADGLTDLCQKVLQWVERKRFCTRDVSLKLCGHRLHSRILTWAQVGSLSWAPSPLLPPPGPREPSF